MAIIKLGYYETFNVFFKSYIMGDHRSQPNYRYQCTHVLQPEKFRSNSMLFQKEIVESQRIMKS